jgi:hypothetical protein
MAHLSEDTDLTFNEIVSILGKVANAEIENATEKVDGQNLFLSWTITPDGEVEVARAGDARTARNAGDIKKGGMTTDEYISKWAGHPAESAFTNGFKAISTALRGLSPEDLEAIFANGQRYVNMEIMYPGNPNIILYSAPNVVLHGLQDFGEDEVTPEMRQLTKQKFTKLVSLVDGAVEKVGNENWSIHGPKIVALKKLADGSALEEVTSKIEAFAAPVGMDAAVGDYVRLVVKKYAEQVEMPDEITEKLLLLMLEPDTAKDQGITVVNLKKGLPKEIQSVVSKLGAKTNSRKYIASVLQPLEIAISDFAIEVLRGVKSYFVNDNDEEVARMRAELEQSIAYLKSLQSSGDEKMGELIDKQLGKLGKIENLASSMEGVVFEYPPGSDRIYKLTGAFAMANQIIGRARRSGMSEEEELEEEIDIDIVEDDYDSEADEWYELRHQMDQELGEPEEDESDDPVIDASYPKTVAIVPGAFKPPHRGHADMVRRYATGDGVEKADKVYVVISAPLDAHRTLRDGTPIDATKAITLWKKLFPEVANLPGVEFEIAPSDMRSPITLAFKYISDESPLPLNDGDRVMLGASDKADTKGEPDWCRWNSVDKEKHVKPGIELLCGEQYAVPALERPSGKEFSATDMRNLISDLVEDPSNKEAYEELAEFVPTDKIPALLDEFVPLKPGEDIEENSMASGGTAGGYSGPLGSTLVKRGGSTPGKRDKPKTKKKKTKKEYIDLGLLAEVMELIIERGINNESN